MPPPHNRERLVLTAACLACLAGLAWVAWLSVGGLGVGVLGLLVLFVAVRMDLESDRPVGSQTTPGLYAEQYRAEGRQPAAERASLRLQSTAFITSARAAMAAGGLLVAIGFGSLLLAG